MIRITYEWLKENGACQEALAVARRNSGKLEEMTFLQVVAATIKRKRSLWGWWLSYAVGMERLTQSQRRAAARVYDRETIMHGEDVGVVAMARYVNRNGGRRAKKST